MIDVFGGTGVVSAELLDITKKIIINDFLYSNEVIYRAFFGKSPYDYNKLLNYVKEFNSFDKDTLKPNYVSENYGNRYFNYQDAKLIGYIRQKISDMYDSSEINQREFDILLASLLYSFDKCANTVGHYEAYIKGNVIRSRFSFDLIEPIKTDSEIEIYREDSNDLARRIKADMAFIDPPYNSRQYSRFYHVLETIVKWDKPILIGTAKKPPEENMSDYCRNKAAVVFKDLVDNLNVKYIVVTYNNTYDSNSSSSKNKITLNEIKAILEKKGKTKIFDTDYHRFNAGKTSATNHKEYVFITKVGKNSEK